MNRIIEWFAGHPVAANLLMVMIIAAGLMSIPAIKKEIFPGMPADVVAVTVPYPGATPEEVEEAICARIEEAVEDIEGIKEIRSTARENVGTVSIEVERGFDKRKILDEIKGRVDAISTFPDEAERPIVREVSLRRQVVNISIAGHTDEATLKRLGERVRDELTDLPAITQVALFGTRPYEIAIEISEHTLRRHGLTFRDVVDAVRRSSLDVPGGVIKTPGGEILLRAKGQAYREKDFANIVLLSNPDGTALKIGDVAEVSDGFADVDMSISFNGKPAVIVQVYRVGDQSVLDVSEQVENYVARTREHLPEGIEITSWRDRSLYFRSRLELLLRNGLQGLALVMIILALFLKPRVAFWVGVGIAVSFLGTLSLLPVFGVSLNMITLFAFVLVLGIVVDDAIVIGENIHTEQEKSGEGLPAAIRGARGMATPVIFAVLTTVAAFVPMLNVPGRIGRIWAMIPAIVIPTLVFSLIESLLVLPHHLSHYRPRPAGRQPPQWVQYWETFHDWFAGGLRRFIQNVYRPFLEIALRWRYLSVAIFVALLILLFGFVRSGRVKFVFFPSIEADFIVASLTMPLGTPYEQTAAAVQRIERAALDLNDAFAKSGSNVVRHVAASVGTQPFRRAGGGKGSHVGEVNLELAPSEGRAASSKQIANRWRELVGTIPDAVELQFISSLARVGDPINVQLVHRDAEKLRQAAAELRERLAEYAGVFDITDSFRGGKQEIKLTLKSTAEPLGVTRRELGFQVRQAFYGAEAQRIQRGRDEVKVMVRYPPAERRSLAALEDMRIRTRFGGGGVPIRVVAHAEYGRGFAAIQRVDRKRAINVTADIDTSRTTAGKVLDDLRDNVLPHLVEKYPGLGYTFEGQSRERRESLLALARYSLLALLIIFALMAIPFRSYVQPLIVMSAIPFGVIGAVLGHFIMGLPVTILSLMGIVALMGVVVNDSLVMVDYINRQRAAGLPLASAVRESGVARFRPILLTSLTTFAGLTPLLLEKSVQAQFLIPMAVSLAFGVIFATTVTLILVPSLYIILEDIRRLLIGKFLPND